MKTPGNMLDRAKMLEFQIQTKLEEFSRSGDGASQSPNIKEHNVSTALLHMLIKALQVLAGNFNI